MTNDLIITGMVSIVSSNLSAVEMHVPVEQLWISVEPFGRAALIGFMFRGVVVMVTWPIRAISRSLRNASGRGRR